MKRNSNTSLLSDERMRGTYTGAAGCRGDEAVKKFKLVVVPIDRVERINQLLTAGENIRRIAREEAKNQANVRRIVRSYAAQQYIDEVRMEMYGLLENALESVRYALDSERDGKFAYQLLVDLGVIGK